MDAYSAAVAFVNGEISVTGDLFAAIRSFLNRSHPGLRALPKILAARLSRNGLGARVQSRGSAARNIQFHYDRSNQFYQLFLDPWMQYSEGHFNGPGCSLEQAQREKLDRICRHLQLAPGQALLDIGCGWGGLLAFAAEHYGVEGEGCTLSAQQFRFASQTMENRGLAGRMRIRQVDYRDLTGCFDRIASVGMFEHVGGRKMPGYFRKIYSLLPADGLFLNRGIVRPETAHDTPETLFVQRSVFPGGELLPLSRVIRDAERAGFEVVLLEQVREHYARTCRVWVANLIANGEACLRLVDQVTYRTWILYLAASAIAFEDGTIGCVELVFAKRPRR